MRELLKRSFSTTSAPEASWAALIDAEGWPSWATHIRRVELNPAGPVGPSTRAVIVLTNRTKARVAVTEFDPGRSFCWEGRFLWLGLSYDHVVQPTDHGGSKITFVVGGAGPGISIVGPVFARIYAGNLDRAIPNLQAELNA